MRKYVKWLLPVALLLWCVFIFHFSLADAEQSGMESGRVTAFLNTVLADMGFSLRLSSTFVRKAAHFTEFFALGLLAFGTATAFLQKYRLPAAVAFSFAVPAICLAGPRARRPRRAARHRRSRLWRGFAVAYSVCDNKKEEK